MIPRIAERQPGAASGHSLRPLTVGIDLRSGPRYTTGVAVMDADRRLHRIEVIQTDEALLEAVERAVPTTLVALDAPRGLPEGQCCTDQSCECARHGIMREVDQVCAAAGYHPFPTLLPSMVKLTERRIRLYEELTARSHEVTEVYPGMAQDALGIPRKGRGLDGLRRGLKRAGVRGIPRARRVPHDELDAATCALVAQLQLAGEMETMRPDDPVPLVLPQREGSPRSATRR